MNRYDKFQTHVLLTFNLTMTCYFNHNDIFVIFFFKDEYSTVEY